MTEHPNYKYRPRRRKHNKQRSTSGSVARIGTSLPSPNVPNMSPRYTGYIPNASLSPSIQQSSFSSLEYNSDFTQQSGEKRYSPVNFQQKYNHYNNYVGYQRSYATQKSPYDYHSPDVSPTNSPEPHQSLIKSSKVSLDDDSKDETCLSIPSPALSPLEQEKHFSYSEEKQRISNIQHSSTNTNSVSPTHQNYPTRVQNFRQSTISYTDSQPITSVPMANGLYVMCANKSSVEQGHVVTGTFYPPVATSQDQQLLGSTQPQSSSAGNSGTIHYYSSNLQQYYPSKDYYKQEIPIISEQTTLNYSQNMKDPIMESYKSNMNDPYPPSYPIQMIHLHHNEERSDVDSDVDTREFDKYLKYTNTDSNIIDSNHNYHRHDNVGSNLTYNYHHTSVILPNTNIKPEPMLSQYPEVYTAPEAFPNCVPKTDDDFSEILADVRKTCYSA